MTKDQMNRIMLQCVELAEENLHTDQYPIAAIITDIDGSIIVSKKAICEKKMIQLSIRRLKLYEKRRVYLIQDF